MAFNQRTLRDPTKHLKALERDAATARRILAKAEVFAGLGDDFAAFVADDMRIRIAEAEVKIADLTAQLGVRLPIQ